MTTRPKKYKIVAVNRICFISVIALFLFFQKSNSQIHSTDKCGELNIKHSQELLKTLGSGWGYNYDSLKKDLLRWGKSQNVIIDSIGSTIQGRGIWQLKISNFSSSKPKKVVYIHARTHPNEVQANYVANQIIEQLISGQEYANAFRENAELYIIPMYNPDGVELGKNRENSNDVDLEREWDKNPMQQEASILKKRFIEIMNSNNPIKVALNLHSSYNCKRYFVFHDPTGTSNDYASLQKEFITGVKQYFNSGIEAWNYNITWQGTAPTHFPESWWWFNYNKNVIALTYEDMHCDQNGKYDSTAYAIIGGIGKYLNIPRTLSADEEKNYSDYLSQNLPNPAQNMAYIKFSISNNSDITLKLYNMLGQEIALIAEGFYRAGIYESEINLSNFPKGNYIYKLQTKTYSQTKILTIN